MLLVYGVRDTITDRVLEGVWNDWRGESIPLGILGKQDEGCEIPDVAWPDFRDPATLGCLLALVRERLKAPGIHVRCMLPYAPDMSGKTPPPWVVHEGRGARLTQRHSTEAEALVAALVAAP
jgi:hypothetical protein